MSTSLPQPPKGSCFAIDLDEAGRPSLSWLKPIALASRLVGGSFLAFWLCGWAVGEFFAIYSLLGMLKGQWGMGGMDWCAGVFLIAWLGGWSVGGVAAMLALYGILQKPRPERLVFGEFVLEYDPGTTRFRSGHEDESWKERQARWRLKRREIPRSELGALKVERVGERQRLTLDIGVQRIEIGETLTEPEREWLAEVLRAWMGQS